ncbi:MAG: RNA methyltransferase [Desulfobacteraceae bacterium]|jgi:tRNA/rRNA methyltransferase
MNFKNVSIVLVEPQGPLNIGSVCRTMMNFGFSDLRLVNPCATYNGREARKMALKADILIDQASVFSHLEDSLADCHFVMGTTRRLGKYREDILTPDKASDRAASYPDNCKMALVFGREDRGLLTEEIDLCQTLITIPTHDDFASMNLAQAVTICLYEMNKTLGIEVSGSGSLQTVIPCEGRQLEAMFRHMRETLLYIDYSDPLSPDHILRAFRRIFGRATLSERDIRVLQGLWSRIDWIENQRRKLS